MRWSDPAGAGADAGATAQQSDAGFASIAVIARAVPPGWPFPPLGWPLSIELSELFPEGSSGRVIVEGAEAQALARLATESEQNGRPIAVVDSRGDTRLLSFPGMLP